jgi:hypothetical protein
MSYKGIENNTISKPKARKKVTEPILTPLLRQKKKEVKAQITGQFFTWVKTEKNPEYEEGLKTLPFESCLIHNKWDKKNEQIKPLRVQTKPKYLIQLQRHKLTPECDFEVSDYFTDNFKAANNRKIKAMKKFGEFYQPLYEKKKVTLWFLTFTRADKCRPFKEMINIVRKYYKRIGLEIRGFVWTNEISENLHWHYHLCVATDRINLRGGKIPKLLKFDKIWGQRTEIDFVKKNVVGYMSKYFAKSNLRHETGFRSYGVSQKFK